MSSTEASADKKPRAFIEREREFAGTYSKEVFEVLRWGYQPFWGQVVIWIGVGWISRLLLMGNTLVMGYWIDSLSAHPKIPNWVKGFDSSDYFVLLCWICGVGFGLTWISRVAFSRISVAAVSSIYDEVTLRVSRFPMRFFDRTPVGRVVTRFSSDYGNIFRMFGGPLSEFFSIVFDLTATLVLLFSTHWLGVTSYFLLLGLNLVVYMFNKQKIRAARREQSHMRSPSVAHFAETVQGASVIRVFGKGTTFFKRFNHLDNKFTLAKLRAIKINTVYASQMVSSTYGVAFLSAAAGLWLITQGLLTAGELSAIIVLLNLAGSSFQMFFDWMAQFEDAFVGVERMNEYLRLPLESEAALPATTVFPTQHCVEREAIQASAIADQTNVSLEFKDVWFRYDDDLPWILKGVSLKIKAGEKIGIVGRTGAGKTSVFQMLQAFYQHQKGEILYDGVALGTAQARECLAVIPQEPALLNATVRENLCLEGEHTDAELLASLQRVGLSTWLERSPKPLDMFIEERGKNLSQGEKQLLVMARMSLVEKPLVLMDEATSSIDPQTELALVHAMTQIFEGRTQIIIAHRLSTIESCHRVLWLKDGHVALFDRPEVVLSHFQQHGYQQEQGI